MEEKKFLEMDIEEKMLLKERIGKELKTISRSIIFNICIIPFLASLFFWIGSIYLWEEFFSLGLFLTAACLVLSAGAIMKGDKLMPEEKALGRYLDNLNCELELFEKMLSKLKNEKRVMESLDPTDIAPYREINIIYRDTVQQAKMLVLLIEGGNDQDVFKILEKIYETCSVITFEIGGHWIPKKIDFSGKSQEEKLARANLFIEELGKKKAACADLAARDKKKKLMKIAEQVMKDEEAINEINAKIEITRNRLSVC